MGLRPLVPSVEATFTFRFREQQRAGDQLRHRRRPSRPGGDLVLAEVADRRQEGDRGTPRPGPERGDRARHRGRWLVRSQALLRRRARGGRGLQAVPQAGEADVAPRRRLASGPHPPDGHVPGSCHPPRRQGAQLPAAAHQRLHRPRARAGRGDHRDGGEPAGRATSRSPRRSSSSRRTCPTTSAPAPGSSGRPTTASTPAACATSTPPTWSAPASSSSTSWRAKVGQDPYRFRRSFLRDARARAVLDKVAEVGGWGRTLPAGVAQGIAFHGEYHSMNAVLVELDTRPETTGPAGPRRGDRPAGHPRRGRRGRRSSGQPEGARGADAGLPDGRHRAHADLQPAPARRPLPGSQLGQLLLHPAVEHPAGDRGRGDAVHRAPSRAAPASSASPRPRPRWPAPTGGRPERCPPTSRSTTRPCPSSRSRPSRRSPPRPPTA